MKDSQKESEITIEMSEQGFRRVLIGADTDAELSTAHRLLAKVAPELRALDKALREPAPHGCTGGVFDCPECGEERSKDVEGHTIDGRPK